MDCFIPKFKLEYEDLDNIKTDRVNTVVFNLYQIKRLKFFSGHPVLVTRNGMQYSKLNDLMSKLVYEAIGNHIHPTRYRQIVETESAANLSLGEQDITSHDQKHSSHVARTSTYYQKISS